MTDAPFLKILPEVAAALSAGGPVVALESTIISHGMPYPDNVHTALQLQGEVRLTGAVPATIAVMDGRLCVGLDEGQIDQLGRAGRAAVKVSRRDLSWVLASGRLGATTVASTMMVAALAGIRVFATGGIGGVHRGATQSLDISADLHELARTPVLVVCAGAKSILDLPLTLEVLETLGVPVLGYRCDEFPAFFSRESGLPVQARLDQPHEVARVMHLQWDLQAAGMPASESASAGAHTPHAQAAAALGMGGMLLVNPIALEFALPRARMDAVIDRALAEAAAQGVTGKDVTPFLLNQVNALTGGDSLAANRALVQSNARLAGEVALAFARTRRGGAA